MAPARATSSNWVSVPLEQKRSEIEGIKHVYSISRPACRRDRGVPVGVDRQPALVRLYNQVYSNQDWLPPGFGVGTPIVKPKGIDDVPVMALTLWSDDPAHRRDPPPKWPTPWKPNSSASRTRDVYTIGAPDRSVLVTWMPPGRRLPAVAGRPAGAARGQRGPPGRRAGDDARARCR